MKIEGLVTDVTAVESPDRAERVIFGVILAGRVFGQFRPFCGRGATLWCSRNLLLSSNTFTQGHLVEVEGLVTDVTAVGSPG